MVRGILVFVKCPGCATDMAVKRVISVEIDICPACSGIVLDKGETDVIDALGVARIIEGAVNRAPADVTTLQASGTHAAPRHGPATCHVCARTMIALTGAGDVEYDWCDGCERLFFDRGELSALEAFRAD